MAGIFFNLAALSATIFLMASGPATAQSKTYIEEFKAYTAAIESGDTKAALPHGYAAWQAAEVELGDDPQTTILAYNYGALTIYDDPAKSNAALTRAKELMEAGFGDVPLADLELYLAYTTFKLNEEDRGNANALRKQLEHFDAEGFPPSQDRANMWFALAAADIRARRYRAVRESGARAEAMVAAAYPSDYRSQAMAIMFQGISWVAQPARSRTSIIKAVETYQRAGILFPPQENIETFDEVLAQVIAWNAAAQAVYETNDYNPKFLPEIESETKLFAGDSKSFEECGGVWAKRDPPNYPRRELHRGYLGAVLIGYHFGDDTSVHDVRILAEVPVRSFGEAVLKEVSNWKLAAPLPDDPGCRKNQTTSVHFIIN